MQQIDMSTLSLDFAYAYGGPESSALFRRSPEDFVVNEIIDQPISGEGEHFWLRIRKRGENTDWIAKKLANYFSVRTMDVGYGGKKDRHAVTTQWFSIYLPKSEHTIDWPAFINMSGVDAELLESGSHKSKLKKGDHNANTFVIRLHELSHPELLPDTLSKIQSNGVPNYFGEQRFGRDGGNLEKVTQWVADPRSIRNKSLRGLIISSARSYLFNTVLSKRIQDDTWTRVLPGDTETVSASGPLWGRGRSKASLETEALESGLIEGFSEWCSALENVGLNQERRLLALKPSELSWSIDGNSIEIEMTLGSGEYATSVLRELATLKRSEPSP